MKHLLISIFLLMPVIGFSQEQTAYYLNAEGEVTFNKDSASTVRVITSPGNPKDLLSVAEYYMSGKKKRLYKSSKLFPVNIEGSLLSFYEDGHRHTIETYTHGRNTGSLYEYYHNGQLYLHKEFPAATEPVANAAPDKKPRGDYDYTIPEAYDSVGKATVVDGNGICIIYNDNFKDVAEQGPLVNGKRNGTWKGFDQAMGLTFEEKYTDGVLVAGSASGDGVASTYANNRVTFPKFAGEDIAFGRFLGRQIRYPAADRQRGVQGTVVLAFNVEKDGSLSNLRVVQSVSPTLDAESLRVLKSSPKWKPATKFGMPVKMTYNVPINYALGQM